MSEQKGAPSSEREEEGPVWLNIAKIVFLIIVLVAAWFVLEWLLGRK
jgi:hypothetical protein